VLAKSTGKRLQGSFKAGGKSVSFNIHGAQCHDPELLAAYDAAADWIQKNGYEIMGLVPMPGGRTSGCPSK
jgi:hypothetical protein